MKKYAYTLLEVVFVIVIIGILSAVAIPKFAGMKQQATIANGRSDIAAIRSSILSERQGRLVRGEKSWIGSLSDNKESLFEGSDANHTLLYYGIKSGNGNGKWQALDDEAPYLHYSYTIDTEDCNFTYDPQSGKFTLDSEASDVCKKLVE